MSPGNENVKPDVLRGAVIYTDGSARPNPNGYIGYGAHGYIYELTVPKAATLVANHAVTNKGYLPLKRLGKSQLVLPVSFFDYTGSTLKLGSNNEAELTALQQILTNLQNEPLSSIHLMMDSEYVKQGIEKHCLRWSVNGWKRVDGESIANCELWVATYAMYQKIQSQGTSITLEWVRGHNDVQGNVQADMLATIGMNYSTAHEEISHFELVPAKKYLSPDIERHPFISYRRIYFNSVSEYNKPGTYFQADTGYGDFVFGKRIPEAGYSIIHLKKPEEAIEIVKQRQFQISRGINAIIMMKLDRVYAKDVYPYLQKHGRHSLIPGRDNLNLNFVDKRPINVETNPTGLSLRALESINLLEDILNHFIRCKEVGYEDPSNQMNIFRHDITDVFYEKTSKQVKGSSVQAMTLKPEYIVGFKDMTLNIQEAYMDGIATVVIPLTLGMDILPRNNLKRLENLNPAISLITWRESANAIRYATVIECDDGLGIWSNFYADKVFLRKDQ